MRLGDPGGREAMGLGDPGGGGATGEGRSPESATNSDSRRVLWTGRRRGSGEAWRGLGWAKADVRGVASSEHERRM